MLIDIHTHHSLATEKSIRVFAMEASPSDVLTYTSKCEGIRTFLSVGIHPSNAGLWEEKNVASIEKQLLDQKILMIGEIGLDRTLNVSYLQQKRIFNALLTLANRIQKPILLHAVRSMSDMFAAKQTHQNIPVWIIHGFRGGAQQTQQYIKKGFYLSFGPQFNPKGLSECPMERMFLETDAKEISIQTIYARACNVIGCTATQLENQIEKNFFSSIMNRGISGSKTD